MGSNSVREEACEANRRLPASGLVLHTFGNVSAVDRSVGIMAIKPSGVAYEKLTPADMVLVSMETGKVVEGTLPAGHTTVGMRVQLDHLQPNRVGTSVTAEATLEKIEGRRLTFTVNITDKCGLVAVGKLTRVVVEVEPFLEKAH